MTSPFANILHRDAIRHMADAGTFQRGQRYFEEKRVTGLARRDSTLAAIVRGTTSYRVRLWVKDAALAYACTCPMGEDGAFCKHGVAVALAWLAQEAVARNAQEEGNVPSQEALRAPPAELRARGEADLASGEAPLPTLSPAELRAKLASADRAALVDLLVEAMILVPGLREHIHERLLARR